MLKPIPSKQLDLVPPTSAPNGYTQRVLRKRKPLGGTIPCDKPAGRLLSRVYYNTFGILASVCASLRMRP
jgi:hypothetical protein